MGSKIITGGEPTIDDAGPTVQYTARRWPNQGADSLCCNEVYITSLFRPAHTNCVAPGRNNSGAKVPSASFMTNNKGLWAKVLTFRKAYYEPTIQHPPVGRVRQRDGDCCIFVISFWGVLLRCCQFYHHLSLWVQTLTTTQHDSMDEVVEATSKMKPGFNARARQDPRYSSIELGNPDVENKVLWCIARQGSPLTLFPRLEWIAYSDRSLSRPHALDVGITCRIQQFTGTELTSFKGESRNLKRVAGVIASFYVLATFLPILFAL